MTKLYNKLKKYTAFWFVVICMGIAAFVGFLCLFGIYPLIGAAIVFSFLAIICIAAILLWADTIAEGFRQ